LGSSQPGSARPRAAAHAARAKPDHFFADIGGWKAELETLLTPKFHYIGAPQNGIS
jgi:hypothetical protein